MLFTIISCRQATNNNSVNNNLKAERNRHIDSFIQSISGKPLESIAEIIGESLGDNSIIFYSATNDCTSCVDRGVRVINYADSIIKVHNLNSRIFIVSNSEKHIKVNDDIDGMMMIVDKERILQQELNNLPSPFILVVSGDRNLLNGYIIDKEPFSDYDTKKIDDIIDSYIK